MQLRDKSLLLVILGLSRRNLHRYSLSLPLYCCKLGHMTVCEPVDNISCSTQHTITEKPGSNRCLAGVEGLFPTGSNMLTYSKQLAHTMATMAHQVLVDAYVCIAAVTKT